MSNKVFTCIDFEGVWPVGVAAVVVAKCEGVARDLLALELKRQGLTVNNFTVRELGLDAEKAIILNDGNY